MLDTILFDCWNTLVQAPNLMKRGASIEIFHNSLLNLGLKIGYEDFRAAYIPVARKQIQDADKDDYRELNYVERLRIVLAKLEVAEPEVYDLTIKMWSEYIAEWPKQSEFFPDTLRTLDSLKGRYKMGVITNFMDVSAAWEVFNKLNFKKYFSTFIISKEIGYRKPNKILFEKALTELGSYATRSIMVGDTFEADIVGARNVGIRSVLIDFDNSQKENHRLADAVIGQIGELLQVLDAF